MFIEAVLPYLRNCWDIRDGKGFLAVLMRFKDIKYNGILRLFRMCKEFEGL